MSFKSIFSIIVLTFLININSYAQVNNSDNNVGKNYTIQSKFLSETREIQIYTPNSYHEDVNRLFPVLYVLDGQEYFLHGVAYQDMLRFRDKSPEFIIVGINTDRRKRRELFYKDSNKFTAFLKQELIPFVDNNYRTKKGLERLYFGWEMAAGLGFEILTKQNELFSGFILASPTHSTDKRMKAVDSIKGNAEKSNKYLLVTAAPEEHWITNDTTFLSIIDKKVTGGKPWRYTVLDREDHYTTPLKTIHEGLSDYFSDYKPIRLRSLKAYDDYGGLEALRAYYKQRGDRYGLPTEIHKETKHFLIYNAMTENNYSRFNEYVTEFNGYIETNSRDFWLNRYAKFYLKHQNIDKALYLYKFGVKKYPDSDLLYTALGDTYKSIGDEKNAFKAYKKAIDIKANK